MYKCDINKADGRKEKYIKYIFQDVIVTGTPQLLLDLEGLAVDYDSGTGTDTLLFNYTIQSGHNDRFRL